jgi:hypothetical protein
MTLSIYGWVFMIIAWGAIIALSTWTMWKIIFPKKDSKW